MRAPFVAGRNIKLLLVVFSINTVITYILLTVILPPRLEQWRAHRRHPSPAWQSKQLKQFVADSRRNDVPAPPPGGLGAAADSALAAAKASSYYGNHAAAQPGGHLDVQSDQSAHAQQQHGSELLASSRQSLRAAAAVRIQPQALSARSRKRVPLVQFLGVVESADSAQARPSLQRQDNKAAEDAHETPAQAAGAAVAPAHRRGGGGASSGRTYGGLFDYKGPAGVMWARAFYLDEHTIGLVLLRPPRALRRQVCVYRKVNAQSMDFKGSMGESHGAPVDKLTVICRFADAIAAPLADDFVEIWDTAKVPIFAYDIAKAFTWSVCIPPMHVNARYEWVSQLLRYYISRMGADYFFFYSAIADITAARLTELGVDYAEQYSSVVDMSSQMEFKPYYFAQTTAIHDCLYLNKQIKTEWTLFQDLDELLVLPAKWPDPLTFFETHKDKHAITFGMWSVDSRVCRPESEVESGDQDWPLIVRMKKATRGPYCGNMCIDWRGRRKYVLQPAIVEALFIHKPIARPLLNLPVSDGFMRNFWRAQNKDVQYCSQIDTSRQT
eukprot:scpid30314/ scgid6563/ 